MNREWSEFNLTHDKYEFSYSTENGGLKVMYRKREAIGYKIEDGNTVTVYDRYLFAVPVRGIITETKHDCFRVDFFTNNPGKINVNKHDGSLFLKGQCKVDVMEDKQL
jgi:hypothetical protein